MMRLLVLLFALVLIAGLAPTAAADVGPDGDDGTGGPINPGSNPAPQFLPDPPGPGCVDANLQTSAVAESSGGGATEHGYGPDLANNGIFGTGGELPTCCGASCWNWISAGTYPTLSWYQLEWPAPIAIGQIFVDTKPVPSECGAGNNRGLHGADIQTWDGSAWVDHGSVTNASDDWGFTIPGGPVMTTRLRLNRLGVVSPEPQSSNPILYELKVYDCAADEPVGGSAVGQVDGGSGGKTVEATRLATGRSTMALIGVGLVLVATMVWGGRRLRHPTAHSR